MKDPLQKPKVIITVGKKKFDQTHIPSRITLKASEKWNDFMVRNSDPTGKLKCSELELTNFTLDLSIFLLKREWNKDFGRWWKGLCLSREKLLDSMSMEEIKNFIDDALEPILGSKKKGLEAQRKLFDATAEVFQDMSHKDLVNLLSKLPSLLAGQGKAS
jgi:hypothetical protein